MNQISYDRAFYLWGIESDKLYYKNQFDEFHKLEHLGNPDHIKTIYEKGYQFFELR